MIRDHTIARLLQHYLGNVGTVPSGFMIKGRRWNWRLACENFHQARTLANLDPAMVQVQVARLKH